MGNCVETCRQQDPSRLTEESPVPEKGLAVTVPDGKDGGGVRVKVVLTKVELEWLLLQLSSTSTATRNGKLEEFLREIERERRRSNAAAEVTWKPSLESITEAPEFPDMDRS